MEESHTKDTTEYNGFFRKLQDFLTADNADCSDGTPDCWFHIRVIRVIRGRFVWLTFCLENALDVKAHSVVQLGQSPDCAKAC
jgi:hypothetical protein